MGTGDPGRPLVPALFANGASQQPEFGLTNLSAFMYHYFPTID